ncbi:AarF/ABC1/UbiB kinase family protein [Sorangium sp. So ce429]
MSDSGTPTGKLSRMRVAGAAAAQASVSQLRYATKRLTGDTDDDELRRLRDESIGKAVFQALGQLRGGALKISQMLAAHEDLVPPAVRQELAKASYRAPSLNRAVVRRMITMSLGQTPEQLFASFEPDAFAAASLGQVHRAVERDTGRRLAVKIQYPGIGDALRNDIAILRALFTTLAAVTPASGDRVPTRKAVEPLLAEIEDTLLEEVDYRHEALTTSWFRKYLKHDLVVIPEVVPKFSSSVILTTTLLEGKHLEEWLATNPSKEERDRIGQALCDVFFECVFELGIVHADPNPGNYIFTDDGRLGLIDFGCVQLIELRNVQLVAATLLAYAKGDLEQAITEYQRVGMLSPTLTAAQRAEIVDLMRPSQEWVSLVLGADEIDFAEHPEFMTNMRRSALTLGPAFQVPRRGLLYLSRALGGLFSMLTRLGAKVTMAGRVPPPERLQRLQSMGQVIDEVTGDAESGRMSYPSLKA